MIIESNESKMWRTAIYLRRSKDERNTDERNAIENQREFLLDFVTRNPDI